MRCDIRSCRLSIKFLVFLFFFIFFAQIFRLVCIRWLFSVSSACSVCAADEKKNYYTADKLYYDLGIAKPSKKELNEWQSEWERQRNKDETVSVTVKMDHHGCAPTTTKNKLFYHCWNILKIDKKTYTCTHSHLT